MGTRLHHEKTICYFDICISEKNNILSAGGMGFSFGNNRDAFVSSNVNAFTVCSKTSENRIIKIHILYVFG